MNTASSLTPAPRRFQPQHQPQNLAKKCTLICNIAGVASAASLLSTQAPVQRGCAVVELTIGTDPQTLVLQAVARVRHPGLNRLLASFVREPEICEVLLRMEEPSADCDASSGQCASTSRSTTLTWPIQRLRRAAELAQYLCAFGREEREVLYVATLLQGSQPLLNSGLQNTASQQDVLRTLVRKSLCQLEEGYPRQAWLLRQSMGWGLEDEVDDFYVPRLQQSVSRALSMQVSRLDGLKIPDGSFGAANLPELRH